MKENGFLCQMMLYQMQARFFSDGKPMGVEAFTFIEAFAMDEQKAALSENKLSGVKFDL